MAASYVGIGAFASGTGALSVGVPSGYQDGDIFVLAVESANESVATPAGWSAVPGSPQSTGTAAAAGGVRLSLFWKVVSGAQSSVSVADSGNHTTAAITCWRGLDNANPFHATAGAVQATASTSWTAPAVTTLINDSLIAVFVANDRDLGSTTNLSGWTNATLGTATEVLDQTINSGVGGGLGIAYFPSLLATPGSSGTTSITSAASNTAAMITVAFRPTVLLEAEREHELYEVGTNHIYCGVASLSNGRLGGLRYDYHVSSDVVYTDDQWATEVSATAPSLLGFFYETASNGSVALAFRNGGSSTHFLSSDLATWTEVSSPSIARARWSANQFAGFTNGGNYYTSPDASSWTTRSLPTAVASGLVVGQCVERFLVAGRSGSTASIAFSTDGVNWTAKTIAATNTPRSVAEGNGRIIYTDAVGAAWYSLNNGDSWSSYTLPANGFVSFVSGKFLLLVEAGSQYYLSGDAVSWTAVTPGNQTNVSNLVNPVRSGDYFWFGEKILPLVWRMYAPQRVRATGTLTNAGPAAIELAATAAALTTASSTLTVGVRLAASAANTTTASAALTVPKPLAATAAAESTASAALSLPILFSSTTTAAAATSASLTTQVRLNAAVVSAATAAAGLTAQIRLAAAPQAGTSVSAALSVPVLFSASVAGSASVSGALATSIRLATAASVVATAASELTAQVRLASSAAALSTSSGAVTTSIRLVASPTAQTNQVNATLNTGIPLSGSLAASVSSISALSVQTLFAAAVAAQATPTAALTGASAALQASVVSQASHTAILSTLIEMQASRAGLVSASAELTVGALLAASVASQNSTSAALTVGALLSGSGFSATATTCDITVGARFMASLNAETNNILASLNTGIPFVASAVAQASASAAIQTSIRLEGQALAQVSSSVFMEAGAAEFLTTGTAVATAQASLTTGVQFVSAAATTASTQGALSTGIQLAASTSAQTNNVLAQLSTGETMVATASASTAVTAILTTGTRFVGQALVSVSATAELGSGAALAAAGQSLASAQATLTTEVTLASVSTCSAQAQSAVTVGVLLVSAAQASSDAFSELDVATRFTGLAEAASAVYADLATEILLAADASAQAELQGLLSAALSGLGASGFRIVVPAELRRVSVPANDNTVYVLEEPRGLIVRPTDNLITVPGDPRAVMVSTD